MEKQKMNWSIFEAQLNETLKTLKEFTYEIINLEFSDNTSWTKFYFEKLLPYLAKGLDLHYGREYLTVDAIFYKKDLKVTNNWEIPLVFIESENSIQSILPSKNDYSEFYKLCCLNAPLKVIFTYAEVWDENQKKIYVDDWQSLINAFTNANKLIGELVIIIVQKDGDKFLFHSIIFDDTGHLSLGKIIEIP